MAEQSIVDGATGERQSSGLLDGLKVVGIVERNKGQMIADIGEEKQSSVAADPALAGHSGQGGIDFGQAMRSARGVLFSEAEENIEARLMVFVIAVESGDKHGGVQESLHVRRLGR
jgi:hypothetical protein